MFRLCLLLLSEIFLILRRIKRDIVKNVDTFSCTVPVICNRYLQNLKFSDFILEKISNIKFNKYPSSANRMFSCRQADGQIDMTKLIIAFQNFAKAPENNLVYIILNLISTLCD